MVEPTRIGRTIGEEDEYSNSQGKRRQSFENKQPLPTVQAKDAIRAEDEARYGSTDDIGQWYGEEIGRRIARAQPRRKPEPEVEDHPGRKAGFRKTEQESQHIKTCWPRHKGVGR